MSRVPLLALRTGVLLPGTSASLPVGRDRSVALVDSLRPGDRALIAVQKDSAVLDPGADDLHTIGVLARVDEIRRTGRARRRLTLTALYRVVLDDVSTAGPFLTALTSRPDEGPADADRAEVLEALLREKLTELRDQASGKLRRLIEQVGDERAPGRLAERVAAGLGLESEDEAEVLAAVDVGDRLEMVTGLLSEAVARGQVRARIDSEVRRELNEGQREAILRKQLEAIQRELKGESAAGGDESDFDKLSRLVAEADLPDEVRATAEKQLARLQGAAQGSPAEAGVIRNYLDWILALPWNERADESLDIAAVEAKLNADHFGLDEVKKRILGHLAVMKRGGSGKGTILCLSGPPGVGKTSPGRSIAEASGRPFVRIALGGVRDEAELRGHRRTCVGALPGRIIAGLKQAGAKNPVLLLDEIDKLGTGWMGSPEAALLEILAPEQNSTFTDHYLELPFDLSEVVFLCTANDLSKLTGPLRDRLEVIEVDGYTLEEEAQIGRAHLLPRQLDRHALDDGLLTIDDDALDAMVEGGTREAGVRQLERQLRKVCRALALRIERASDAILEPMHVDVDALTDLLGRRRFFRDAALRTSVPGVATGMAWTPVGGDILFIEASRMPGSGKLQTTGQLGDVMRESASAALTYVRSNAERFGVEPRFLDGSDIHGHVPAGGVPKDGPSAGVTMFVALTSLLTGRRVRPDTAMTGEATLRGRVLPVGGIKSKVLAAHRAGLTRVILPERNRADAAEIPARVSDQLEIIFVSDMADAVEAALSEGLDPTHEGPNAEGAGPVRSVA
ncbi:MAG: endopeptidase La [Proteobacteria bacterium]|nr:endopeptidase La [Pseudomonadota bacterium]